MKKHLLMKTLLVALVCLVGGASSVWASSTTSSAGATDNSTAWNTWDAGFTKNYTMSGDGSMVFNFHYTSDPSASNYAGWTMFIGRTINTTNVWDTWITCQGFSGGYYGGTVAGTRASSNTYAGTLSAASCTEADVVMTLTRAAGVITAVAAVDPTNGADDYTITWTYTYDGSENATADLYLSFAVEKAFLDIKNVRTAANGYATTNVLSQNYESFSTGDVTSSQIGWVFQNTVGSSIVKGTSPNATKYLNLTYNPGSASRNQRWDFDIASSLTADNYTLTFSALLNHGTANSPNKFYVTGLNTTQVTSANSEITYPLLGLEATAQNVATYTVKIGQTTIKDADHTITLAKNSWYKFTITVSNIDNVGNTATIYVKITSYDESNVILEETQNNFSTANIGLLRGLCWNSPRSNSGLMLDDVLLTKEVNAATCADPTYEITGAANTSRKFTLACETPASTIYYSETEKAYGDAGWLEYSSEVTTSATTIWTYAATSTAHSSVTSFATGAGTTVNLAAATVTHSNNGVYTIASDQSAILGAPTATIHYQIDGGSEQTSTNASVNVDIDADGTLTYWLTADGYGATAPADETVYAPRAYATTTTLNFCTNSTGSAVWAYNDNTSYDKSTIEVATVNTDRTYYKYLDQSGNIIGDGMLAVSAENGGSSWRIDKNSAGVHPYNKTEYVVLLGMEAGQLIQIAATSAPSSISNLTVVPAATYTGTYTYTATADGEVIFSLAKDVQLKTIKLLSATVPVEVTAAGFATYVPSYDLNFSATEIEAYKVKVTAKGVATLTKVNNVPAGTPVLLYKDGGKTEDIPVMTGAAPVSDNDLVAGTGAAVATTDGEYTNMILNVVDEKIGFYFANGQTVAANRAYLHFATSLAPAAAARMTMIFEDEDVTGVNEVRSQKEDVRSEWFDLQGRKVAQPQKGLYIVNGKKVMVK